VSRADFRRDARIEGTGGLFCLEVITHPASPRRQLCWNSQAFAGVTLTSSCNGWCRTPRPIEAIAEAPSWP